MRLLILAAAATLASSLVLLWLARSVHHHVMHHHSHNANASDCRGFRPRRYPQCSRRVHPEPARLGVQLSR